jgi:hypothetical protein
MADASDGGSAAGHDRDGMRESHDCRSGDKNVPARADQGDKRAPPTARGRPRATLAALAVMAIALLLAPPASAIGALAVDSARGKGWGASWDHKDRPAAAAGARAKCGSACAIVLYFWNGCGAWAADQADGSTVSGWGINRSLTTAQNTALSQCRKNGGKQCQLRVWACETR